MERQNRVNRQFSKENSVNRNVRVNGNNGIVQEICNDSCCKISYSHDLSSDNLNKSLEPEEYVPAYQCDKPSGYVFVDVGSNLIESVYLLEEEEDICKVSSETVFTDSKDIDYKLINNVTIEKLLQNFSKENDMHSHNLETTVSNINDFCTGNDRSGFSTNACMANICENLDHYDKKPSIDIDYTTTSTVVSMSEGCEKVNTYVKEEKSIEDVLVHQSTKNMSLEIKQEDMVYNEEVSVLNESIIDVKLNSVNKVEELLDISTNYSHVLDKNSKTEFIVLSKSVNTHFQEVHTECSEELLDNCDIGNAMVLKPLEENETVQSKRESRLKLQNKVQTLNRTCSELQIKPHTNSGDDTCAAGVDQSNNKLSEQEINTEVKNENDAVCQHHRKRKSKNTTYRHYICKVCNKDFTQLCNLIAHKRIHTGDRPFSCDTCGKAFTRKAHFIVHKRIHTGDRPFGCDTCGKTFKQLANLKEHKRVHSGDRPFGCDTCGKVFKRLASLKRHKLIHTSDRPFNCNTCGKTFTKLAYLKVHKRIHTGDRPFNCNTCGKTFTDLAYLKVHKRIHTGDKPFGCDTCGKAFRQLHELKAHKRKHTGDSPYGCDICGKKFTRPAWLKRHKRIHTGDRPFNCNTCGKTFTELCSLKRHKHIHTGDKPFGCDTCGKTFTQKGHLKNHIFIHTTDRPFDCDTCGKAFRQLHELTAHKYKHTGDSPHGCVTCGKTFTLLSSLKRHKLIHTGDRPFNCNKCDKTFTELANLKRHKHIHTGAI